MLIRLTIAVIFVLLSSCGSATPPVLNYPMVKPLENAVPTRAGSASLGTAREIPSYKLEGSTSIGMSPFMGGGGNQKAVPQILRAPAGKVFVIIAFTDQPVAFVGNLEIEIQCNGVVLLPDYVCQEFYPQSSRASFDPYHSFCKAMPKTSKTSFKHPPFAVAFEIDSTAASGGTLVVDTNKYPIVWK